MWGGVVERCSIGVVQYDPRRIAPEDYEVKTLSHTANTTRAKAHKG
jgi:hypothetical protein